MGRPIPKEILSIIADLARERGVPLDTLLHDFGKKAEASRQKVQAPPGKFRVLGIDKYSGEDWIQGDFDLETVAVLEARRLTFEAKPSASHHSVATVYYAYDDRGIYLGGDIWLGE